jgi:pimeloyl-ACP methyl ester carboxylesterase
MANCIKPLDMNGLAGRMAVLPAPAGKKAEILFIYGQHSSLERWWGVLKYVNKYGAVTAPDLPGFGGMESFYKLGTKPTIDNYADYLAAFVKMRYRRKKVVIVGMSFGFVVATRMLQRYPELSSHVRLLVSLAGLTHYDDFIFPKQRYWFYRTLGTVCSHWLPARLFSLLLLNSLVLRHTYAHTYQARGKFAAAHSPEEFKRFMDMEVKLWHINDLRTHAYTLVELLTLDNCTKRLSVPLWHVTVHGDQYLNAARVEQHLRVAFEKVRLAESKMKHHAPSIIADEAAAAPLIPSKLRRVMSRL